MAKIIKQDENHINQNNVIKWNWKQTKKSLIL